MKIFLKKVLAVFVFLFFLFPMLFPPDAHGLSFGGVGIRASGNRDWFIYNLGPGEKQEDYVEVFNYTEEPQRLIIQPYDSEPSNIGAFALTGPNNVQKGIGVWIKLETNEITLEPGEARKVNFTIEIPLDADVGEHSGAITAMTTQYKQVKGMQGAAVGTRVGARVYNTVPGEMVKKIAIVNFDVAENILKNEFQVQLTAKNEGNISVSPMSRLFIDGFGLLTRTKAFHNQVLDKEWQLLRDAEVTTYWQWPRPYFGRFTFYATLNYEEKEGVPIRLETKKITFVVIPWRDAAILGGILLFIIAAIISWILYRKKKYSGKGWDEYVVDEKDNVMTLAQKCHIPWKLLVKVNKVKSPYFLIPGNTILVPPGTIGAKSAKGKKAGAPKGKEKRKDRMKAVILILIIVLTTVVLVLGVFIFVKSIKNGTSEGEINAPIAEVEKSAPTPTPSPLEPKAEAATTTPVSADASPAPTPAQQPELKKEEITLRVLNGSGIRGLAGVYAQKIKDAGFVNIETGNADNFQYQGIQIRYRAQAKPFAEEISLVLEKDYKNLVLKEASLDGLDIEVVVGAK